MVCLLFSSSRIDTRGSSRLHGGFLGAYERIHVLSRKRVLCVENVKGSCSLRCFLTAQACELLDRRRSYIEEKMKRIDEEVAKMNDYYNQLRFLDVFDRVEFSWIVKIKERYAAGGIAGDHRVYTQRGRACVDFGSKAASQAGEAVCPKGGLHDALDGLGQCVHGRARKGRD